MTLDRTPHDVDGRHDLLARAEEVLSALGTVCEKLDDSVLRIVLPASIGHQVVVFAKDHGTALKLVIPVSLVQDRAAIPEATWKALLYFNGEHPFGHVGLSDWGFLLEFTVPPMAVTAESLPGLIAAMIRAEASLRGADTDAAPSWTLPTESLSATLSEVRAQLDEAGISYREDSPDMLEVSLPREEGSPNVPIYLQVIAAAVGIIIPIGKVSALDANFWPSLLSFNDINSYGHLRLYGDDHLLLDLPIPLQAREALLPLMEQAVDRYRAICSLLQAVSRRRIDPATESRDDSPASFMEASFVGYKAYQGGEDKAHLATAVELARRAVALLSDNDPRWPGYLGNLSVLLSAWHEATGEQAALAEAIEAVREAVRSSPEGSPKRPAYLSNLGNYLSSWFALTGQRAALEEALEVSRESVRSTPENDPNRPGRLNNYGNRLSTWYSLTEDQAALEEAIMRGYEAVQLTGRTSPDRPTHLHSLSGHLYIWYRRTRARRALEDAIRASREAVELVPRNSPGYGLYVSDLATLLGAWSAANANSENLDEAIEIGREAVNLTPKNSPACARRLMVLGILLGTSYLLTRARSTLGEAISVSREAVRSAERPDMVEIPIPYLRHLRTLLAYLLMFRGEASDIEEAHGELTQALAQQDLELVRQQGEREVLDYLRGKENVYEMAVRCRLRLAEQADGQGVRDEAQRLRLLAWQAAEQGKGRLFTALLAAERQVLAADDPEVAKLEARIQWLREDINRLQVLIDPGTRRGGAESASDLISKKLVDRLSEYAEVINELQRTDRELAGLTAVSPLLPERVQTHLHKQHASMLEFYPLDDRLIVFLINGSSIHVASVPVSKGTLTRWTELLESATQDSRDPAELPHSDLDSGKVVQPALEALLAPLITDPPSELLLVPTGPLHLWPLHLLPFRDGILWDYFAISYVPTADTFVYCQERVPEDGSHQVLLAPNADLPATFLEAAHARRHGWQVELLEEALPETLRRYPGDFALASHVLPDPEKRGEVNQVLFGDGPHSALELLRILRGRPKAEHGMLGSCSAHYEEAREGDTLTGLTRSFLAAGLRSLTSSLWPVDDLVACYLGCRFRELVYEEGYTSKARALRAAALELKQDGWPRIARWIEEQLGYLEGEERALALGLRAACALNEGMSEEYLMYWQAYQEAVDALPPDGPLQRVLAILTGRYGEIARWMVEQGDRLSYGALQQAVDRQVRNASRPLDALLYGPMILLGTRLIV